MAEFNLRAEGDVIYFEGILNASADLTHLGKAELSGSDYKPLQFNLRDLKRCDSIGIQKLHRAIDALGDRPFEYHECNLEFAQQLEMLPSLLGKSKNGQVISLRVVYECTMCDRLATRLAMVEQIKEWHLKNGPPDITCPCDKKVDMEPEDDLQFEFIEELDD